MHRAIILLVAMLFFLGQSVYAAEAGSINTSAAALGYRAARAGGTIRFTGAITVGTSSSPTAGVNLGTLGVGETAHSDRFSGPARSVVMRPIAKQELSSQLKLLERPGEAIDYHNEVIVIYK